MIQELSLSPEMLDKIAELAGVAKEQSIEIAHEYLAWWFWQSVIVSASSAIAGVILAIATRSVYKHVDWDDPIPDPFSMFGSFILAAATVGAFCTSSTAALDVVKISVAPRAYVIDKFLEKTK